MPSAARIDRCDLELVIAAIGHDPAAAIGPWTRAAARIGTEGAADEDLVERHVRAHATHAVVELVRARGRESQLPAVGGHEPRGSGWQSDGAAPLPVKRWLYVNAHSRIADGP